MELVQEVYEGLQEQDLQWPDHALIAVRDSDGEIKFSSVGKDDVVLTPYGIYMRGHNCLYNSELFTQPKPFYGTTGSPDIITRADFENYLFVREVV